MSYEAAFLHNKGTTEAFTFQRYLHRISERVQALIQAPLSLQREMAPKI